jgi:hypothetical protein
MTMIRYHHTQIGYVIFAAMGGFMLLMVKLISLYELNWIPLMVLIILAICLVLFATLTVEIGTDVLEIRFGPGLVRKRFPLQNIESYRRVKNRWYYGWGIHRTPRAWLYNVSGLDAVELQMRDGKGYRIGTDDPEGLTQALHQVLGH